MPAKPDRWVGLVCLALGVALYAETFSFHRVDWDPLGLPFWPRVVIGLLAVASLWLVAKGRLGTSPPEALAPAAFAALAGMVGYAALIPELGFYVATPLFLFLFQVAIGGLARRRLVEAVVVAAVGTLAVWVVFTALLEVQFPLGLLEGFGD